MIVECERCGAPLDVSPGARIIRCGYCNAFCRPDRLTTVQPTTPAGWVPPAEWTPPEHLPEPSVPHSYGRTRSAGVVAVAALVLSIGLIGLAPILVMSTGDTDAVPAEARPASGELPPSAWRGEGTLWCQDQQLVLRDRDVSAPTGTMIMATRGCELRLIDCRLSGLLVVSATGDARVFVEGGTHASYGLATFQAFERAVIDIRDATVSGTTAALHANQHSRIQMTGGVLRGETSAIYAADDATVAVDGVTVTGPVVRTGRARVSGVPVGIDTSSE